MRLLLYSASPNRFYVVYLCVHFPFFLVREALLFFPTIFSRPDVFFATSGLIPDALYEDAASTRQIFSNMLHIVLRTSYMQSIQNILR